MFHIVEEEGREGHFGGVVKMLINVLIFVWNTQKCLWISIVIEIFNSIHIPVINIHRYARE